MMPREPAPQGQDHYMQLLGQLAAADSLSVFARHEARGTLEFIEASIGHQPFIFGSIPDPVQHLLTGPLSQALAKGLTLLSQLEAQQGGPDQQQGDPGLQQLQHDAIHTIIELVESLFTCVMISKTSFDMVGIYGQQRRQLQAGIAATGLLSAFATACSTLADILRSHPHQQAASMSQHQITILHSLHRLTTFKFKLWGALAMLWHDTEQTSLPASCSMAMIHPTFNTTLLPIARLGLAVLQSGWRLPAADPPGSSSSGFVDGDEAEALWGHQKFQENAVVFGLALANHIYTALRDVGEMQAVLLEQPAVVDFVSNMFYESDDISSFMLALLGSLAQKMHRDAQGVSVWGPGGNYLTSSSSSSSSSGSSCSGPQQLKGKGTSIIPAYHLQLLDTLGLAPLPDDELAYDGNPELLDDANNAFSVAYCLRTAKEWRATFARLTFREQNPGVGYRGPGLPGSLCTPLVGTLAELQQLVKTGAFVQAGGGLIPMAVHAKQVAPDEAGRLEVLQLLEPIMLMLLPGIQAAFQDRDALEGVSPHSPMLEPQKNMIAQMCGALTCASDAASWQQLQAFFVKHPAAAAAGMEQCFRFIGRQLVPSTAATVATVGEVAARTAASDAADAAAMLPLAQRVAALALNINSPSNLSRLGAPGPSQARPDSQAASQAWFETLQLHPALASALTGQSTSSSSSTMALFSLLLSIVKFAATVIDSTADSGNKDLSQWAAITYATVAAVVVSMISASSNSGSNSSREQLSIAGLLLGRCLLALGQLEQFWAATSPTDPKAAATAQQQLQMASLCSSIVQLLGTQLVCRGLPALEQGSGSTGSGGSSRQAEAAAGATAVAPQLQKLQDHQAAAEAALSAASKEAAGNVGNLLLDAASRVEEFGAAACALLPSLHCCNAPGCTSFGEVSELVLVRGGRLRCSGCNVACFCCRHCQRSAWPGHKPMCSAVSKE